MLKWNRETVLSGLKQDVGSHCVMNSNSSLSHFHYLTFLLNHHLITYILSFSSVYFWLKHNSPTIMCATFPVADPGFANQRGKIQHCTGVRIEAPKSPRGRMWGGVYGSRAMPLPQKNFRFWMYKWRLLVHSGCYFSQFDCLFTPKQCLSVWFRRFDLQLNPADNLGYLPVSCYPSRLWDAFPWWAMEPWPTWPIKSASEHVSSWVTVSLSKSDLNCNLQNTSTIKYN